MSPGCWAPSDLVQSPQMLVGQDKSLLLEDSMLLLSWEGLE